MNEVDRFFERRRQNWNSMRRLGVRKALCPDCGETSPHCFLGDVRSLDRDGDTLVSPCERCKRKAQASKDQAAVNRQWAVLRNKGCSNDRCHCGEDNPFCMEADHIDGEASSNCVFAVCINCHLKRTRRQLTEYPSDGFDPRHPIIIVRNRVRGMTEHLELAMEHLRSVEQFLQNLAIEEFNEE